MNGWTDAGMGDGPPRWWFGPLAAIGTALLLAFVLALSAFGSHPLVIPLLFAVPAFAGYLVSVRRAVTIVAEATAVGTSLGWVLFMGLVTALPFARIGGFVTFPILAVFALVLMWATQRSSAGLAARLATRYSWDRSP
ncbi:MAG: hypothetical protein V3U33_03935 [candidate division NC10 bacterium]